MCVNLSPEKHRVKSIHRFASKYTKPVQVAGLGTNNHPVDKKQKITIQSYGSIILLAI